MTAGERLIEKGFKEGFKEGQRLALLARARKMLSEGLSTEQVARFTNLTPEQLRELQS